MAISRAGYSMIWAVTRGTRQLSRRRQAGIEECKAAKFGHRRQRADRWPHQIDRCAVPSVSAGAAVAGVCANAAATGGKSKAAAIRPLRRSDNPAPISAFSPLRMPFERVPIDEVNPAAIEAAKSGSAPGGCDGAGQSRDGEQTVAHCVTQDGES